jgi:hypothetical protein
VSNFGSLGVVAVVPWISIVRSHISISSSLRHSGRQTSSYCPANILGDDAQRSRNSNICVTIDRG